MDLLKENQDKKINWKSLSFNPSIFELDYDFMHQRMQDRFSGGHGIEDAEYYSKRIIRKNLASK